MTAGAERDAANSTALILHLARFPEDLRDIRRLQRRFGLSADEVARALDAWRCDDQASPSDLAH